jgi:hypothetical protein
MQIYKKQAHNHIKINVYKRLQTDFRSNGKNAAPGMKNPKIK